MHYLMIRYEIGQQYKPHMDYFRSDEAGIAKLGNKSDRIATVITYLGTPDEGGRLSYSFCFANSRRDILPFGWIRGPCYPGMCYDG